MIPALPCGPCPRPIARQRPQGALLEPVRPEAADLAKDLKRLDKAMNEQHDEHVMRCLLMELEFKKDERSAILGDTQHEREHAGRLFLEQLASRERVSLAEINAENARVA